MPLTASAPSVPRTSASDLPITSLIPNPTQPRQLFDETALAELAGSLQQYGMLQPIVVRPSGDQFEIIAGERRWRAAKLAEFITVPCTILNSASDEEAFILSVTENVVRRDMTIIEEARAYQRIVALGRSREEVAQLFGKTPEHITYRIDLLSLRDDIQDLAAKGQLSRNMAWYLARLSLAGQADVMRRYLGGEFVNEDSACRAANAVYLVEQQPGLLGETLEQDTLLTAKRQTQRKQLTTGWENLGPLGKWLGSILELSAVEIAQAMGPETALYEERLRLMECQVRKAHSLMDRALALSRAVVVEMPS